MQIRHLRTRHHSRGADQGPQQQISIQHMTLRLEDSPGIVYNRKQIEDSIRSLLSGAPPVQVRHDNGGITK